MQRLGSSMNDERQKKHQHCGVVTGEGRTGGTKGAFTSFQFSAPNFFWNFLKNPMVFRKVHSHCVFPEDISSCHELIARSSVRSQILVFKDDIKEVNRVLCLVGYLLHKGISALIKFRKNHVFSSI